MLKPVWPPQEPFSLRKNEINFSINFHNFLQLNLSARGKFPVKHPILADVQNGYPNGPNFPYMKYANFLQIWSLDLVETGKKFQLFERQNV